jgi:DNA-binding CsgD family transcriptional regulator
MAKTRSDDVGLADLLIQARIANRLLAAQLKPTLGQQEMVRLLHTTGASNAEIADVLNTTPATVATTLQRLKKGDKKGAAEAGVSPIVAGAPSDREL